MTFFYDFNISPTEEIIDTLEKFNYTGACIFYDSRRYLEDELINEFNQLKEITDLKLYHGVVIDETNPELLRKQSQRYQQKVDLIMANGGNSKINRIICETNGIHIINHPYANKHNSGLNHILAKLLVENDISVNINLRDILNHRGFFRAKTINQINQLLQLQRKYGFRCVFSSGCKSFYDVKSPKEMLMLSQMLDMDMDYAKNTLSKYPEEIIKNITLRKESIVKGVKIVND